MSELNLDQLRNRAYEYLRLEADFDEGRAYGWRTIALLNLSSALGESIINHFRSDFQQMRSADELQPLRSLDQSEPSA